MIMFLSFSYSLSQVGTICLILICRQSYSLPIYKLLYLTYLLYIPIIYTQYIFSHGWYENQFRRLQYGNVKRGAMASQITGVSIVYSIACSGADQRKHQSSASMAFVKGIHWSPVNSPHKGPVTRKMFPFDDVIMLWRFWHLPQRWSLTVTWETKS